MLYQIAFCYVFLCQAGTTSMSLSGTTASSTGLRWPSQSPVEWYGGSKDPKWSALSSFPSHLQWSSHSFVLYWCQRNLYTTARTRSSEPRYYSQVFPCIFSFFTMMGNTSHNAFTHLMRRQRVSFRKSVQLWQQKLIRYFSVTETDLA